MPFVFYDFMNVSFNLFNTTCTDHLMKLPILLNYEITHFSGLYGFTFMLKLVNEKINYLFGSILAMS
jgi:hypothetical protein